MSPTVVGLVLNYRDPSRTVVCARSLITAGVAHVVIWDNSEDSGASAQQIAEAIATCSLVSVVENEHNIGFAAAVNRGLRVCTDMFPGCWVLLINNDATLEIGAIKAFVSALLVNPAAVVAYPDINNNGSIRGTVYYQRHFALLTLNKLPKSFPHPSGCCLLVANDRLKGPLFDEDFFMYGEDVELGWRLGVEKMVHIPIPLVWHEGSASSRVGSIFYETRMVLAHIILADKLKKGSFDYGVLIGGRMLSLSIRALVRSLRFRSLIPIQAFLIGVKKMVSGNAICR